jgi:hypothetical protein
MAAVAACAGDSTSKRRTLSDTFKDVRLSNRADTVTLVVALSAAAAGATAPADTTAHDRRTGRERTAGVGPF